MFFQNQNIKEIDWYEKPVKRYLMAWLCVAPVFFVKYLCLFTSAQAILKWIRHSAFIIIHFGMNYIFLLHGRQIFRQSLDIYANISSH